MPATVPHLLSHVNSAPLSVFCPENAPATGPMSPGKQQQKPKLSLQTSNLTPTFHGSSGGQVTTNLNTATPTTLNTFNNAFDLTFRPSPVISAASPTRRSQTKAPGQSCSPTNRSPEMPYALGLPFGVHSILKNSPLPQYGRRRSACSSSASPGIPGRRVFFPASKKVTFRAVLEEEITTHEYSMRHSDLNSSSDETKSSEAEESSSGSTDEGEEDKGDMTIRVDEVASRGRRKRKTLSVSDSTSDGLDRGRNKGSRSTSARRSKRKRRRWEWMLGPAKAVKENSLDVKDDSTSIQSQTEPQVEILETKTPRSEKIEASEGAAAT